MFLTLRGLRFKPVTFIVEMLENFQEQYAWKWMICLPHSFAHFWSLLGVTNNWFLHVSKYWYVKIICTVVEETNINDPRSYEHYPTSSWNKAWKKLISSCSVNTISKRAVIRITKIITEEITIWSNTKFKELTIWIYR